LHYRQRSEIESDYLFQDGIDGGGEVREEGGPEEIGGGVVLGDECEDDLGGEGEGGEEEEVFVEVFDHEQHLIILWI
jgi:hypothetical protein